MRYFPVDRKIVSGNLWGEDSPRFIKEVRHILIRIGGGYQARHEETELRKKGVHILTLELEIDEESRVNWNTKKNSTFST